MSIIIDYDDDDFSRQCQTFGELLFFQAQNKIKNDDDEKIKRMEEEKELNEKMKNKIKNDDDEKIKRMEEEKELNEKMKNKIKYEELMKKTNEIFELTKKKIELIERKYSFHTYPFYDKPFVVGIERNQFYINFNGLEITSFNDKSALRINFSEIHLTMYPSGTTQYVDSFNNVIRLSQNAVFEFHEGVIKILDYCISNLLSMNDIDVSLDGKEKWLYKKKLLLQNEIKLLNELEKKKILLIEKIIERVKKERNDATLKIKTSIDPKEIKKLQRKIKSLNEKDYTEDLKKSIERIKIDQDVAIMELNELI